MFQLKCLPLTALLTLVTGARKTEFKTGRGCGARTEVRTVGRLEVVLDECSLKMTLRSDEELRMIDPGK